MKTKKRRDEALIEEDNGNAEFSATKVSIEQPTTMYIGLEIGGKTLIQNCFSQKALEMMLRKHIGLSAQRERKVPRQVIEDAKVKNTNGVVCVNPAGIKKALLSAATLMRGLKKTHLRTQIVIEGCSLPIQYADEIPTMAMVRTAGINRSPDIRFRPQFNDWTCRLIIQFDGQLPVQTVVDLLNRAGRVGIGEWRPERDGTHGTFRVIRVIDTEEELAEVRAQCAFPLRSLSIPGWALDVELSPEIIERVANGEGGGPEGPATGKEEEEEEEGTMEDVA